MVREPNFLIIDVWHFRVRDPLLEINLRNMVIPQKFISLNASRWEQCAVNMDLVQPALYLLGKSNVGMQQECFAKIRTVW